jgi:hypothetical protein
MDRGRMGGGGLEVIRYLDVLGEGELVGAVQELEEGVDHGEVVAFGQGLVARPVRQRGIPAGLLGRVRLSTSISNLVGMTNRGGRGTRTSRMLSVAKRVCSGAMPISLVMFS